MALPGAGRGGGRARLPHGLTLLSLGPQSVQAHWPFVTLTRLFSRWGNKLGAGRRGLGGQGVPSVTWPVKLPRALLILSSDQPEGNRKTP